MPEELTNAPGLGNGPGRPVRRLGLEDFADGSDRGFPEMSLEWREHASDHGRVAMNSLVGIEVGSEQPRPDNAHLIRGIETPMVAAEPISIARILRAQRSQPERCEELFRDAIERPPRSLAVAQRSRKT